MRLESARLLAEGIAQLVKLSKKKKISNYARCVWVFWQFTAFLRGGFHMHRCIIAYALSEHKY